jgi:predicted enzyme related to lactoylglutathione lyase
MPTRESVAVGAPCWIDLGTSDPGRAREFYGQVFGWTFEDRGPEYGGYVTCLLDGSPVAGLMENFPGSGFPDAWSTYLAVVDATATASRAEAAGGQVTVEPMAVADQGTMAFFTDPGGASVGAWQPGAHKGNLVVGEPGTPWWHELLTREYAASVRFYEDVFGWQTQVFSDDENLRYTLQMVDGTEVAGVEDAATTLPAGAPSSWEVYFAVTDTDAVVARVLELGGSVVTPAESSQFGRIAVVADPTGATFRVRSEVRE